MQRSSREWLRAGCLIGGGRLGLPFRPLGPASSGQRSRKFESSLPCRLISASGLARASDRIAQLVRVRSFRPSAAGTLARRRPGAAPVHAALQCRPHPFARCAAVTTAAARGASGSGRTPALRPSRLSRRDGSHNVPWTGAGREAVPKGGTGDRQCRGQEEHLCDEAHLRAQGRDAARCRQTGHRPARTTRFCPRRIRLVPASSAGPFRSRLRRCKGCQ